MSFKIELFDGSQKSWSLDRQNDTYAVIGKDSTCRICVDSPHVSARHCRLEIRDNKLLIKDLRSSAGTLINGAKVLEGELADGDIITLGHLEFVIHDFSQEKLKFPLVSKSESWNNELRTLESVCCSNNTVLLLGPSGTGKDVIARTLHEYSHRKNSPFLSVNCSALTETLVESELFGHVKGSFTGAISDRKGAFEAARGGTLFLDEIGDLSYTLQAKLLRALENEEIRPVGSDKNIQTNVRIIAATHQNLYDKIREGSFRADLFYRLNIINVEVPHLKNRMEDFDDLFYSFARQQRVRFSFSAIQKLKKYDWPGNIRELKNVITRAATVFPKRYITDDLIDRLIHRTPLSAPIYRGSSEASAASPSVIKEIEKQMILKRLSVNRGSQKLTALDLGMPKSTLHDRLRDYNIDPQQFKNPNELL